MQFGISEDKPATGDYDGDGKADIAVFRPSSGVWYWVNSNDNSFHGEQFGIDTDLITPADFDGDGKTDLAVHRLLNCDWYFNSLQPQPTRHIRLDRQKTSPHQATSTATVKQTSASSAHQTAYGTA